MSDDDYRLLINICQYCLRNNNLSQQQIVDIDKVMTKLYDRAYHRRNAKCFGKKLKVGVKRKDTKAIGQK